MGDWMEQYSAALDIRDTREQAHKPYIDAFTKLADRTAALRNTSAGPITLATRPASASSSITAKGKAAAAVEGDSASSDLITSLRSDLAATQKARAALQAQVEEFTSSIKALEAQNRASAGQIAQLTRQKTDVERKLRDRDEEIRGKSKLVTEAQDEMVALSLQLNMAEQQSEKLQKDNKELLDRWMSSKREEADRMNRDSRWE